MAVIGNRESGIGNWESGIGNRESGIGVSYQLSAISYQLSALWHRLRPCDLTQIKRMLSNAPPTGSLIVFFSILVHCSKLQSCLLMIASSELPQSNRESGIGNWGRCGEMGRWGGVGRWGDGEACPNFNA
ncbi:MAG: hypothetical protein F6K63_31865 [Moorea sp. SIO1G6]|uniref:hypothetical protein n=1 Tax=unclassified Moorena TaxID=2683338 RepID=UPI0013BF67BC|nr:MULTISPECIES: hypothetical protein [unclassified Moorena]NET68745.1 hypothetical protein [Moorena sp. SIO1G6]